MLSKEGVLEYCKRNSCSPYVDNTPPSITCPGNATVNANGNCEAILADYTEEAVTSDNCGSVTVAQSPTVGSTFSIGANTITWTFDDDNGNSIDVDQDVVIDDTMDPATPVLADVTG